MRDSSFKIIALVLFAYLSAYGIYRWKNTEVWAVDEKLYVIFGSKISYYFFRPASYVDGALTGIRFHIGPHHEVVDKAQ